MATLVSNLTQTLLLAPAAAADVACQRGLNERTAAEARGCLRTGGRTVRSVHPPCITCTMQIIGEICVVMPGLWSLAL